MDMYKLKIIFLNNYYTIIFYHEFSVTFMYFCIFVFYFILIFSKFLSDKK